MARVEFGQRTRAPWHTRPRTSGGPRAHSALAIAALILLTAAGHTAITVADGRHSVAAAATPAGLTANRVGTLPEPDEPGSGGTTPEEPDPEPEPSESPPTEPPATTPPPTTPPPTETPTTEPTTVGPTPNATPPVEPPPTPTPSPTQSTQPPPSTIPRPPPQAGQPRLGVAVSTGDITLTGSYWGARSTATELRVTVTNTSDVPQLVRLRYTLPAGVTDGGTHGCSAAGGGAYRCGAWIAVPGAQFSTRIRVQVDANAWQRMPLAGSVQVSATDPTRPGLAAVTDDEGFAVLFPPGPPAAGLTLAADQVGFDETGQPTTLLVRLGNTGVANAAGTVEVILPAGVTVPTPPQGCRSTGPTPAGPSPASPGPTDADQGGTARVGCDLGPIRAGSTASLRLPVAATPEAQRMAPLSGAVVGTLTPTHGRAARMQMSFRITAVAATAPSAPAGADPAGSQGLRPVSQPEEGLNGVQRTAIGLIVVSALLVVLALMLAAVTLRRRT